ANKHATLKDNGAFTFLIPFTMAIVISITLLVVGAFVVGTVSKTLTDTYPKNVAGDWRDRSENASVNLTGNITTGFANVVDIEIVVMIITGLSMAIFAIMAIGTRKGGM
ncbi:unnamed protein product, partial [marine sediment metagenome]